MKNVLLYFFICFTTCCAAQGFSQSFVADETYGISSTQSNPDPTISIFPNPATEFITIEDSDNIVARVTFYNVLGKEIATYEANNRKTFDMMHFQNGIYLVQLKDNQDQILSTIRVRKI